MPDIAGEGGSWPPCARCQTTEAQPFTMSGLPPLLLPPSFAHNRSRRQRKLHKEHYRMAHNLSPLLIALQGLQLGRTHAPTRMMALHWKCASPLVRAIWRHRSSSPLFPEIARIRQLFSKPLPSGSTIEPILLSQDFNPYHKRSHCLVMRSDVVADLVSLPSHSLDSRPFPLLLPPDLRDQYAKPGTFLSRDDTVWQKARATKAALCMPHKQYAKLLLRLYHLHMGALHLHMIRNGLMYVWKDVKSQRLIFNGRAANYVLQPPPYVELPHPTDLSRLYLQPHQLLLMTKMDMDSYSHRLSVPDWLVPILGLPTLRISRLRPSLKRSLLDCLDGCPKSKVLSPAALTLLMGLSHSVFIAQAIHLHLLRNAQFSVPHPIPNAPIQAGTDALSCVYIHDILFPSTSQVGGSLPFPILALPAAKTGALQSVTIRNSSPFLPLRRLCASATSASSLLFPAYPIFVNRFTQAINYLFFADEGYSPHSVRHGGATADLIAGGEAAIPRILFRGRWESTAARRYLQMGPAAVLRARQSSLIAFRASRVQHDVYKILDTTPLVTGH